MSPTPTNHEKQLAGVLQAGFDCVIEDDTLTVGPIPYRLSTGGVDHGYLICHLARSGEDIASPSDHTAKWIGDEVPHHRDGREMDKLILDRTPTTWSNGRTSICTMSRNLPEPYTDYGQKMLTYARLIAQEASNDWRIPDHGKISVKDKNRLVDKETGLNRVGIGHLDKLLAKENLAVIGAGGTGGHIVDLISKTNVQQIDIFDPDEVSVHTQLRWPGVVERNLVSQGTNKAEYLASFYGRRTNCNLRGYPVKVTKANLSLVTDKTMVFVAIDDGKARREILTGLAASNVNFLDCGIDLQLVGGADNDDALTASARITRCHEEESPEKQLEIAKGTPGGNDVEANNLYARNIQTVEMNSLNATLAVIAWKQAIGFYQDTYGYRKSRIHLSTNSWALYDPKKGSNI